MKLATYESGEQARVGAVIGADDTVVDLAAAQAIVNGEASTQLTSMLALIDGGEESLELARSLASAAPDAATHPLSEVRLLAPLPRPRQMRDFLCFEEYLKNGVAQAQKRGAADAISIAPVWYEMPLYYTCNHLAVAGPEVVVEWPAYSQSMDYELELACVIGKRGKDIAVEDGMSYVFGFTIFNDFSARDEQLKEMAASLGPGKGKDFDNGNVLGPWITTMDEIGEAVDLAMEVRVNGERWGGGRSSAMYHGFDAIIAKVSQSGTLYPGEVLASGTVGTGSAMELGKELSDGDVIELEVEKIGVLRNSVRAAAGSAGRTA